MHKNKRIRFSEVENKIILDSVKEFGQDWDAISKKIPGRSPKQIHDRYNNYLRDGLKKEPWTKEEDDILIQMYNKIGPKWSKMMKNIPGRSGNDIKNRWHKHLNPQNLINHFQINVDLLKCKKSANHQTSKYHVKNKEIKEPKEIQSLGQKRNLYQQNPNITIKSFGLQKILDNVTKYNEKKKDMAYQKNEIVNQNTVRQNCQDSNYCVDIFSNIFKDNLEIQQFLMDLDYEFA